MSDSANGFDDLNEQEPQGTAQGTEQEQDEQDDELARLAKEARARKAQTSSSSSGSSGSSGGEDDELAQLAREAKANPKHTAAIDLAQQPSPFANVEGQPSPHGSSGEWDDYGAINPSDQGPLSEIRKVVASAKAKYVTQPAEHLRQVDAVLAGQKYEGSDEQLKQIAKIKQSNPDLTTQLSEVAQNKKDHNVAVRGAAMAAQMATGAIEHPILTVDSLINMPIDSGEIVGRYLYQKSAEAMGPEAVQAWKEMGGKPVEGKDAAIAAAQLASLAIAPGVTAMIEKRLAAGIAARAAAKGMQSVQGFAHGASVLSHAAPGALIGAAYAPEDPLAGAVAGGILGGAHAAATGAFTPFERPAAATAGEGANLADHPERLISDRKPLGKQPTAKVTTQPPAAPVGPEESPFSVETNTAGEALAEHFAQQGKHAGDVLIEEQQNRRSAQREANTDELTGLGNKRAFNNAKARAEADPNTAIVRFDVNGFKDVNDVHDHATGDLALQHIANVIHDVAAQGNGYASFRVGGDEFALIVPAADAERVRTAIEQGVGVNDLPKGDKSVRYSISGGIGPTDAAADKAATERKALHKQAQGIPDRAASPATAVSDVRNEPIGNIDVEPERFQYKLNTDEQGSHGQLKGVRYNKNLAGIVNVWRDPADARLKVINGHNRYQLAKADNINELPIREIQAPDAATARTTGAMINIAEGNGTAIDAAKLFRETQMSPADLEKGGVSLKGQIAKDGLALAKLHPSLFADVVAGKIPVQRAAVIGGSGLAPEQQLALSQMLEKREASGKRMTNDAVAELVRFVQGAGSETTTQDSLFGEEHLTQSLAPEKAELSAYIKDRLGKDRRVLGFVAKGDRASHIEGAGVGQINVEKAGSLATRAAQTEELYHRLSMMSGPVSDALTEAARQFAQGGDHNAIRSALYDRISDAIRAEAGGSPAERGREGRSDARSAPAPDGHGSAVERGGAPPAADAGQPGLLEQLKQAVEKPAAKRGPVAGAIEPDAKSLLFAESESLEGEEAAPGPSEQDIADRVPPGPKLVPDDEGPTALRAAAEEARKLWTARQQTADMLAEAKKIKPATPVLTIKHEQLVARVQAALDRADAAYRAKGDEIRRTYGDKIANDVALVAIGQKKLETLGDEPKITFKKAALIPTREGIKTVEIDEEAEKQHDDRAQKAISDLRQQLADVDADPAALHAGSAEGEKLRARRKAIVSQLKQYGIAAPSIAPRNSETGDELAQLADEARGRTTETEEKVPDSTPAQPPSKSGTPVIQQTIEEEGTGASEDEVRHLVQIAKQAIENHSLPTSTVALRKWGEETLGRKYESRTWKMDDLYDAIEGAVNLIAREQLGSALVDAAPKLREARELEENLFSTRLRSSGMLARQQFSTPLPIARAAQIVAGVEPTDKILEPTAGTGNLVNFLRGTDARIDVNELEPRRMAVLRSLGFDPTTEDALRLPMNGKRYNVIITNPPYGAIQTGKYSGFGATPFTSNDVAQRFIAGEMGMLRPGGWLVAVMPPNTLLSSSQAFREWLAEHHTPIAYIESPEGAYETRGTSIGTVLMVVAQGKDVHAPPAAPLIVRKPTWVQWEQAIKGFTGDGAWARRSGYDPAEDVAPTKAESKGPIQKREAELIDRAQPSSEIPQHGTDAEPHDETDRELAPRSGGSSGGSGRAAQVGGVQPERPAPGSGPSGEPRGERDSEVVAGKGSGEREGGATGPAADLVPAVPRGRVEPRAGDSAERRAEIAAANDSAVFTPYALGNLERRNPHPRLVVETRAMAGMPAPPITAQLRSPIVDRAWGRSGAKGGISDEQMDAVLRTLSAWDKGHGFLAADDVGVGKTREAAALVLEAIHRGETRILYTTKNENNVSDAMKEFQLVASGTEDGKFPAQFVFVGDYKNVKNGTESLPTPKGPVVYFAHSYNFATYAEALADVKPTTWIADEAHEYKNLFAARGVAWRGLHDQMLKAGAKFAYFTATPAVTVDELGYLYGLKEWVPGGFGDWVDRKLGKKNTSGETGEDAEEHAEASGADIVAMGDRSEDTSNLKDDDNRIAKGEKKGKFMRGKPDVFESKVTPAETEQIMRELKGAGKYIARDLWRGGVKFDVVPVDLLGSSGEARKARALYDQAAELARDISLASRKFGRMNAKVKTAGLDRAMIQSYLKQLLFGMRLPTVLEHAHAAVERGEQVVISLHSVAGDAEVEEGLSEEDAQVPVNERLRSAINRINTDHIKKQGEGEAATYEDLGEIPEAIIARAELLDRLGALPPLQDPVRAIEESFGAKNVAVITGRRNAKQRKAAMGEFQAGHRPVAVISKAGKIGISLHDVNGRRRRMLVADYEWSADTFKQELGRVDRTGQRSSPYVSLVASNLAGEQKFAATIAARMASLGATSKGSAESTGTDALDQFDVSDGISLAAMRNAVEHLEPDTREYFTGSKFREFKRVGSGDTFELIPKRMPDKEAGMRDFLLEMMMFPVDVSNDVWKSWVAARDALRSGEQEEAQAARRTGRAKGEVLRRTVLTAAGDPPLTMVELKNAAGEKRAVLQGFVTPYIGDIQQARGTTDAGLMKSRRYVHVTTPEGELVTGLDLTPFEARKVKDMFGRGDRKTISPADAWNDLQTGDPVTVQGPGGAQWVLHPRRDGRIQIKGATIAKHRAELQSLARFESVGNYLYVPGDEAAVLKFLNRFPPEPPKGRGRVSEATPGYGSHDLARAEDALSKAERAFFDYTSSFNPDAGAMAPLETPEGTRLLTAVTEARVHRDALRGRGRVSEGVEAFHGTPHRFPRFSLEHVGNGEGALSYGWGLYFASKRAIAEHYRDRLSQGINSATATKDGVTLRGEELLAEYFKPGRHVPGYIGTDVVVAFHPTEASRRWYVEVKKINTTRGTIDFEPARTHFTSPDMHSLKRVLEPDGWTVRGGSLYRVELPDVDTFLDWDKPLNEQPERIRDALEKAGRMLRPNKYPTLYETSRLFGGQTAKRNAYEDLGMRHSIARGERLYRAWNVATENRDLQASSDAQHAFYQWFGEHGSLISPTRVRDQRGEDFYMDLARELGAERLHNGGRPNAIGDEETWPNRMRRASEYLRDHGIAGIRYLDGSSRAEGKGDHNYVVFDDTAINIKEVSERARKGAKVATYSKEQADLFEQLGADEKKQRDEEEARKAFGSTAKRDAIAEAVRRINAAGLPEARTRLEDVRRATDKSKTWVDLRGKTLNGARDLHRAMAPFRDPRMEKLHAIGLDSDGKVVFHDMVTAGAISWTNVPKGDVERWAHDIADRAERSGAAKVVLVHNHPSGDPTASEDDVGFTTTMGYLLQARGVRLAGHLVIDHTEGSWIAPAKGGLEKQRFAIDGKAPASAWKDAYSAGRRRAMHPDAIDAALKENPIERPENFVEIARLVKSISIPNVATLLYLDAQLRPVGVEPRTLSSMANIDKWIEQQVRAHAARFVVIGVPRDAARNLAKRANVAQHSWASNIFDIITVRDNATGQVAEAESARETGEYHFEWNTAKGREAGAIRLREGGDGVQGAREEREADEGSRRRALEQGTPNGNVEARRHGVAERDLFGNESEPRVSGGGKKSEPTNQGSLFSSPSEGTVAKRSLTQAERAAKAELEILRTKEQLTKSPLEKVKLAKRIAELEKLVNRDQKISADELSTRARADYEKPTDDLFGGGRVGEPPPSYGAGGKKPAHPMPEPTGLDGDRPKIRPYELFRWLKAVFNPESLGPNAKALAGNVRHETAERFRALAQATHALDELKKYVGKQKRARQVDLWDAYEKGEPTGDKLIDALNQVFAAETQKRTDELIRLDKLSADAAIENYIGRFWSVENSGGKVANFLKSIFGRRPFEGPKSFLKQRTLEHFVDGLDAGLVPPTYNYVESQLAKLAEMERLIGAMHMLEREHESGRAKRVMTHQDPPTDANGDPWVRIEPTGKDPAFTIYGPRHGAVKLPEGSFKFGEGEGMGEGMGESELEPLEPEEVRVYGRREMGYWYAPKDAAALWKNHLSTGLRGNPLYDALTAPGMAATQLLLGFSGFHGTVIATEGMFSELALAMEEMDTRGNLSTAIQATGRGAVSPAAGVAFGRRVMAEYRKPGTHPELAKVLEAMIAGGFRGTEKSEFWSGDRSKALKKALRQAIYSDTAIRKAMAASKVPFDALFAGIEAASAPLMSKYVPLMKTANTYRAVEKRLAELPADISMEQLEAEMWDIIKEMDLRFGQVVYDNYFVNNLAKHLAQAAFMAPGWTIGTGALMARGARDIAVAPKRIYDRATGKEGAKEQPILGRSGKYWVAAIIGTMILNAIFTKLATGDTPGEGEDGWKDFFAFRDGTKDADGNWNRHTIPGYLMHDVYGWTHHPYKTFLNKLSPFWAFAARVAKNETYYGDLIRDPDKSSYEQTLQIADEAEKEFLPLSIQNYREGRKRDEKGIGEIARNGLGVGPAKREFQRTPALNKLYEYLARRGHTAMTPDQVQARDELREAGGELDDLLDLFFKGKLTSGQLRAKTRAKVLQEDPRIARFKTLSVDEAQIVYNLGTPAEQELWYTPLFVMKARERGRNPFKERAP